MGKFGFKDKTEGWLFFATLALGLLFLGLLWWQSGGELARPLLIGDAVSYFQLAEHPGYFFSLTAESLPGASDAFLRTPGYPLFLAIFLFLTGGSLLAVLLVQIILAALSAVLVYRITGQLGFSPLVRHGSAWLLALEPTTVLFSVSLLTETLFVFLLLCIVWVWLSGVIQGNTGWRRYWLVGLMWGMAVLVRPVLYPFTVAAILLLLVYFRKNLSWSVTLKRGAVFLVGVYLLLFPWLLRNKLAFGTWSVSSISGVHAFLSYAVPFYAYQHGVDKSIAEARLLEQASTQTIGDKYDLRNLPVYQKMTKEIIGSDPLGYLFFHVANTVPFFIGNGYRNLPRDLGFTVAYPSVNLSAIRLLMTGQAGVLVGFFRAHPVALLVFLLGASFWCLLTLLMLYGIFVGCCYEKTWSKRYFIWLATAMVFYFAAVAGPEAYYKMRLPAAAFIFILAFYGLDYWLNRFSFYADR